MADTFTTSVLKGTSIPNRVVKVPKTPPDFTAVEAELWLDGKLAAMLVAENKIRDVAVVSNEYQESMEEEDMTQIRSCIIVTRNIHVLFTYKQRFWYDQKNVCRGSIKFIPTPNERKLAFHANHYNY